MQKKKIQKQKKRTKFRIQFALFHSKIILKGQTQGRKGKQWIYISGIRQLRFVLVHFNPISDYRLLLKKKLYQKKKRQKKQNERKYIPATLIPNFLVRKNNGTIPFQSLHCYCNRGRQWSYFAFITIAYYNRRALS